MDKDMKKKQDAQNQDYQNCKNNDMQQKNNQNNDMQQKNNKNNQNMK